MNDLKSEVGGFRKFVIEHGVMRDDPPRRPTQPSAAGKENVKEQRSKGQRPEKFAAAQQARARARARTSPAPHLPIYLSAKNYSRTPGL